MKLLREPLVHFLFLGALVFVLHRAVSDPAEARLDRRIVVTAGDIGQLSALWAKQWQQPPNSDQLRRLVDEHVRERVLYREALALGLDKNDTILRRRMAQKMDFLIADATVPTEPDEEALRSHYALDPQRYAEPARVGFLHVYFNPDRRGDRIENEARATLDTLRATGAEDTNAGDYGDRFLLDLRYENVSLEDVARDFGRAFADEVADLIPGSWAGPIASGYGLHLVFVTAREAGRTPPFEEVRERVSSDYLFELRRETNERVYQDLRSRYEIVIEEAPIVQERASTAEGDRRS